MDFNARQYDPQGGRFLAVDTLADAEGQQVFSPYAAMGNAPESMVDPNGMKFTESSKPYLTQFKNATNKIMEKARVEIARLRDDLGDGSLSNDMRAPKIR